MSTPDQRDRVEQLAEDFMLDYRESECDCDECREFLLDALALSAMLSDAEYASDDLAFLDKVRDENVALREALARAEEVLRDIVEEEARAHKAGYAFNILTQLARGANWVLVKGEE